ncbi:hypothetical protein BDR03DRAFT_1016169 [Suillus americanus]|nr:hypothetical protein BDR03DRAFT_1016169 [Suillus americanus]
MHEAPFGHLELIFSSFLYGSCHLRDETWVSRVLRLMPASAVPDLSIEMNVMTKDNRIHEVLVIGECAFAQDTDSVLRKLKYKIAGHPEVLMVIMIVIDEHQPYRSSGRTSVNR